MVAVKGVGDTCEQRSFSSVTDPFFPPFGSLCGHGIFAGGNRGEMISNVDQHGGNQSRAARVGEQQESIVKR